MRIGVVLPQTEIGSDVGALRRYGQGVEDLGFQHVVAYDHVVGADTEVHQPWEGPYDIDTQFHEPFVLFGFLAGCTSLDLVTGITILPQRQTALVAKQAAEVDLLTRGGFRLGVGIGWNPVEYEALGQDFTTRGRRLEEQVGLLRRYWTERSVTAAGEFDRVTGAGIAPPPVQRPIPIWFGGMSPRAYERMGRLADGWFPLVQPGEQLEAARSLIAESAERAGRDPAGIGMEGRVDVRDDVDDTVRRIERWREEGASHVSINTMSVGLGTVDDHLGALEAVAARLPLD
jgi:probable F420-dependent oxidoreductase